MATIGSVTKREDGRYEGELRTLSVRANLSIVPVIDKGSPNQPDYRVLSGGIEVGAGWHRTGQTSGKRVRFAFDLRARARAPDDLHQSRPGRGANRSGRQRPDLEPTGLSRRSVHALAQCGARVPRQSPLLPAATRLRPTTPCIESSRCRFLGGVEPDTPPVQ
jgi:uncharacterized protein (DUF736 family)